MADANIHSKDHCWHVSPSQSDAWVRCQEPTHVVEHGLVTRIALDPAEMLRILHPHVGLGEHGLVEVAGDGHQVPQGLEPAAVAALEGDGQVQVPAFHGRVYLVHARLARDDSIPPRMDQHTLRVTIWPIISGLPPSSSPWRVAGLHLLADRARGKRLGMGWRLE